MQIIWFDGTTSEFLQYFGLNNLAELPKLEEFHVAEKDIELPEHLRKEEEDMINVGQMDNLKSDESTAAESQTTDPISE